MKPENNWKHKTLENLEKDELLSTAFNSTLVKRACDLRRKVLNEFTTEDLRLMIGQQTGLNYLVPLALEVLTSDLFAEGDFFEGDLLQNVLKVRTGFWDDNKDQWLNLHNLLKDRKAELFDKKLDISLFYESKQSKLLFDGLNFEQQKDVLEGLAEANRGKTIPHFEAVKLFGKWGLK